MYVKCPPRPAWCLAQESLPINPYWDFPGGPGVKNLLSNARDMGLIPGWGNKIPHATGQLSPRAATREKPSRRKEEPACLKEDPVCHS